MGVGIPDGYRRPRNIAVSFDEVRAEEHALKQELAAPAPPSLGAVHIASFGLFLLKTQPANFNGSLIRHFHIPFSIIRFY